MDLSEGYAEASHAFLLKDFATTRTVLGGLLDKIEASSTTGSATASTTTSDNDDFAELARKVWILQITLLASDTVTTTSSSPSSTSSASKESELNHLYNRIQRYYQHQHRRRRQDPPHDNSSAGYQVTQADDDSSSQPPIHPSILVALSLAGLKLKLPGYVRRTLEEYFDVLLLHQASPSSNGSYGNPDASFSLNNGDSSAFLDSSTADLSLSGIAVSNSNLPNGVGPGQHSKAAFPSRVDATTTGTAAYAKSYNRLARIYSIHLLGKTLNEWEEARVWIESQIVNDREEGEIIEYQLINEASAKSLLSELSVAKHVHERELQQRAIREHEEKLAVEAERKRKEKEAEEASRRSARESAAVTRKSGSGAAGQQPPPQQQHTTSAGQGARTANTSSRASDSGHSQNGNRSSSSRTSKSPTGPSSRSPTASAKGSADRSAMHAAASPSAHQATGFASFRNHLSNFLTHPSTQDSSSRSTSSGSSSLSRRQPNTSTFSVVKLYLQRVASSGLFSTILIVWIILRFWKQRALRLGRSRRDDVSKAWQAVRDRVVNTVKMGGSMGYL